MTIEDRNVAGADGEHFSRTGGARLGMFNATWPYAELTVFRSAIRLNCLGQEYLFAKDRIAALAKYRALFSIGLLIRHTVPVYPKFVVFWVSLFWSRTPFEKLKEQLIEFGYEVRE
jgi:hypothetical protein